jgi:subtilase family serine protease
LRDGENDVTLKLDEGNAVAESSERNNIFQFKLILKP